MISEAHEALLGDRGRHPPVVRRCGDPVEDRHQEPGGRRDDESGPEHVQHHHADRQTGEVLDEAHCGLEHLGGDQGQPGKIGVGENLSFTFRTTARTARITAMVHPDFTPDNYVTALIDLRKPGVTPLERFDIGDDEKRMTVQKVGPAGTVTLK